MENQIKAAVQEGRTLGLIRQKTDVTPPGTKIEQVQLSFAQYGVPTLNNPLYFSPNNRLDGTNSVITAIEVVDSTTQGSIPGKAVDNLTPGLLAQGMFYAVDKSRRHIFSAPLASLIKRLNNGKPTYIYLHTQIWQNCYIAFNNVSGLSTSNGFSMNVFYVPKVELL